MRNSSGEPDGDQQPVPEEQGPRAPRPSLARRIAGSLRLRILTSFVILLILATIASVFAVRQVMLVRLNDRVESDLAQEVQEFRRLANGIDPNTGRPFGTDANRIFRVYLDRNVPGVGEQLLVVPIEGQPRYRATEIADHRFGETQLERWRNLEEPERGELVTPGGDAEYSAVPLRAEGETLGTFVVAHFTAGERESVDEAVQVVALVALGALLLGTAFAFYATGRVLVPLREFRDAARSVSGANLKRRINVEGDDELADLGQTFNRMLDRLEFAFSSQRDFIRDVSHELRTPIAVVRGHVELLAGGQLEDPAERAHAMQLVTSELDRMSGFVDDLLLLAKSERPDFLVLETVAVDELCEEIMASGRSIEADREWDLEVGSTRVIVADRRRLTQAMMNLVSNAIAHTGAGDSITIGVSVEGEVASLRVADSGSGIDADERQRIFERFERGSGSRRRYDGSGLGLAIVKAVAEAHGGHVDLQSEPGEGSVFFVRVPVEGPT